jgi:hypothetical protein
MERVPVWVPWVLALVLVALGIWSATDENWSGVLISAALAVLCVVWATRLRRV